MQNWPLLLAVVGFFTIGLGIIINPVDSSIPPTNAFSSVIVDGVTINADRYNDKLYINTPGSLTTSITGDTITIKISALTCPALQGVKSVDSNGNFVCGLI